MKIKKNLAETLIYLGAYIGGAVWNCVSGMRRFPAKAPAACRGLDRQAKEEKL